MPIRAPIPPGCEDIGNGLFRRPDGTMAPVAWTETVEEAFEKGRKAKLQRLTQPPYPEGSEQYRAWCEGLGSL